MPRIVQRVKLAPNTHLLTVEAPEIAAKCAPGQFVIVMPSATGERIPLNIADWDREKGLVSVVFLTVGTTTRKLALFKEGDELPVFAGPLGRPPEIARYGTVLLFGGCFGPGALHPIARALKQAGNRVILTFEGRGPYHLFWEEKLRAACDELHTLFRTENPDMKSGVGNRIAETIAHGGLDMVMIIGCTHLMETVAEATRPLGIKTIVSLNPIMLDGTGMCGACRVCVCGKTAFACVDGPFFDGHAVDWPVLNARRKAYLEHETRSLCEWEREEFE